MSENAGDEEGGSKNDLKIVRSMKKYGLENIGEDLERKWTHENPDERYSIRELATYFNTSIVKQVFKNEVGYAPAELDAEDVYELLSDDDAPEEDVEFARNWLRQNGVDPDELAKDFVSYHTVFSYLRDVRGAESPDKKSSSSKAKKEKAIQRMKRLKHRVEKVATDSIDRLQREDLIPDEDYTVDISFRVRCSNCDRSMGLVQFLREEGCGCGNGDDSSDKK
jgi:hypothetical protein